MRTHRSTDLEVLYDIFDFLIVLDPLFFVLLGDFQRTRESIMDVVRVEGCSDLVDITVDESLGPRHDGLGLRALLGSRRRHAGNAQGVDEGNGGQDAI